MNIDDIRAKLSSGSFEFSHHAFRLAVERNIGEAEIREAGVRAEVIEDYPTDKLSPSCLLLGFTRNHRPLHIQVCYSSEEMAKIITLYEPDEAEWSDFRTRRKS